MNVREFIELLGEYPAEMRVVLQGYEDGYNDVTNRGVARQKVKLNAGKEVWVGDHLDFDPAYDRQEDGDVDGDVIEAVVAIRRPSR